VIDQSRPAVPGFVYKIYVDRTGVSWPTWKDTLRRLISNPPFVLCVEAHNIYRHRYVSVTFSVHIIALFVWACLAYKPLLKILLASLV